MFVVTSNPTFSHKVKVSVPVDGGHQEQSFTARFRVLPVDRADKFDLSTETASTEFLRAIVDDMSELVDAEDKPVTYNDRMRDQLIALPYIRAALTRTYFAAIGKALEGN